MWGTLRKGVALFVGLLLIGLGIIGMILPLVPGIPFFLLGLGVLSASSRRVRGLLEYLKGKASRWRNSSRWIRRSS